MPIRILLADDHAMVRRGLHVFLSTQSDMVVVGEASDGQEALQQAAELEPDVVLMDLHMPVLDGIETARQLRVLTPSIRIIVLTSFSDQDHVVPAVRAGVKGYLLKDIEPEDLAVAIRNVHAGQVELHPAAAGQLMHVMASAELSMNEQQLSLKQTEQKPVQEQRQDKEKDKEAQASAQELDTLTRREREVLGLIAQGLSNKEIAAQLVITEKTVKTHVSHLLDKLGLSDRTQAAIHAVRKGWVV
ncbi:RNA polymerase sigma factor (sigma-70 family) [Paenibacillus amylolyticus]|uniref:RNA polymerase sigma factor (Sigma-70 family) n=1 Tax=Paenibacillus amylolyticus TaxID=1451 RepID=A0AAP5H4M7_PAEAM|nr:response regulator transcription factor [Paenibacillus amylolyticus]MDR6723959.1 RNA polymerase sigma factor (sigma-70 family) [Paenibacillus amylolyticus]